MDKEIKRGSEGFYIGSNDNPLAEIIFEETPSKIVIEHTWVDDSLAGQGLGKALVYKVAEMAKAEDKKLLLYCSYAEKVLSQDPEYAERILHE